MSRRTISAMEAGAWVIFLAVIVVAVMSGWLYGDHQLSLVILATAGAPLLAALVLGKIDAKKRRGSRWPNQR